MAINIDDLDNKVENEGLTEEGRLSASEFNRLVSAVMENQGSVHSVSLNNSTPVLPDENGNLNLTIALGDYEQVLTLKYNGEVLGGDNNTVLSADGDVTLQVQYSESEISQSGEDISYTPTGQIVTLSVIGVSATGDQTVFLSRNLASVGHASDVFTDIKISQYLTNGEQNIQFRITNTINANPKQQNIVVVKANLELRITEDAPWYRDAKIMDGTNASITPKYIVLGAVEKTLHVKFTGTTSSREVTVTNITSSDPNTEIAATFAETSSNSIGFFTTNGVRTIEAWITCTYGGQSVESNHIVNNIIVVADMATATPMIAVQSLVPIVSNYETLTVFSWNMFNPALGEGQTSDVRIVLANEQGTTTYLSTLIEDARNNTIYPYSQNISIDGSGDYIDIYVFAEVDDTPVSDTFVTYFQVDNTVDYSAVPGADFYLNPGLRSNSESNPARIINASDGTEIVNCIFENMSWQDGVDGWMTDSSGRRVLRIAAGSKITIPYNVYSQFTANSLHHLTIELNIACRNVTNEDDPVLTIGNRNASDPKGVYMKPLNGAFMPNSLSVWDSADISWQENTRTHIVFNICHNYTITNPDPTRGTSEPLTKQMSLIRTYINGVIEKEFTFDPTNASEINAGGDIVIGQNGCDIDIYGIRVYKDTNDKSNLEPSSVIRNVVSALSSGVERAAFKERNDILQGGLISLSKALSKGYNCIVWHGLPVNKNNSNDTKRYGYFDIYRHKADGTLDREHSGTLYGCELKGQGTTAMGYSEWNDQWKEDKKTGVGHDEYKYNDGGTLRNVFVDVDGNIGYGKTKFGYKLEDGDPVAKKLVGKINYASSMQSHKMGACNLYNDLYRALVGESVTDFSKGERVTVKEEPFLYFVQRTEGSDDSLKVFQGLMTFGPGKADKPTWGVGDEDLMAGDCIIEGALNNNPLTDARVPFVDNGTVTYSVLNEAFMYAGEKNLNFDYGDTADLHDGQGAWERVVQDDSEPSAEVPTTAQVKMIQPIFNFLYLMNVRMKPWDGSVEQLNEAAQDGDFDYKSYYWMNTTGTGYSRFDLYRCHYTKVGTETSREFVPAGIRLVQGTQTFYNFDTLYALNGETRPSRYYESDMWYDVDANGNRNITLNIKSALENFLGITIPTTGVSAAALTSTFKQRIADIFASYVDMNLYLNKSSNLFHHEIMLFWAGTDNRSKNTYYRIHPHAKPVTVADETYYRPNMEMNDDDLDTIFKTNNSGVQSKPYYIEMHDTFLNDQGVENTYWDGQDNILNNTLEATYGRALGISGGRQMELQSMMNGIYTQMSAMANNDGFSGSPLETLLHCMEMYMFRAQKYFPAVAYNETARIRYEVPAAFYSAEQPAAAPLTQSLGDQFDSEREYIKRRIIMLAGYAGYRIDSLSFRDYFGQYVATIIPHYWLYPMSKIGNPGDAPEKTNVRVQAGSTYSLNIGTAVQGNTILIDFLNELTDLGNIGGWGNGNYAAERTLPIQIASERLKSFKCYGATASDVTFPLRSVQLNGSRNLEVIDCHNCATLTEITGGISALMRLRYIDLRGTAVTSLPLPQTTAITEVYLPSGFTEINIVKCPNLEVLSLENYAALTSVVISSDVQFSTLSFVRACFTNAATLQKLIITDIDWSGVSQSMMMWICDIPNVTLTGSISMSSLDFEGKVKLIQKFGDIDSEDNPLYITYIVSAITNIYITGEGYFCEDDKVVEYKKDWRGNFILDSENNKIKTRPALNGLRRDVFNDGIEVEENGVFKYNGSIIKAYRVVSDNDGQNSVSSAKWSISGDGVTNRYFELVHPTADGGWESHDTDKQYTDMVCYIRCIKPIVDSDDDFDDNVADTLINISVNCSSVSSSVVYTTQYRGVRAYNRKVRRGDFVYHDGWYDGLTVLSQSPKYMKIKDIDSDWFNMSNIELVDTSSMPSINEQFELLTEQPSNWSTHFKRYYTYDGTNYNLITNSSAPTFASNTYYFARYRRYVSGTSHELAVYIVRDTDGHWVRNKEVVGICFYISDQDPADRRMFAACIDPNTVSSKAWGIQYNSFPNPASGVIGLTYQDPFDNLYNLTTSQPSNWETNYADYYTKDANDNFYHVEGDTAPTWTVDTYYSKVAEKDARSMIGVLSNASIDDRSKAMSGGAGHTLVLGNNTMRVIDDLVTKHKMRARHDSEYGSGYSNPAGNDYYYDQIGKRSLSLGSLSDTDEYNGANRARLTLNKLHKVGLAEYIQSEQGQSVRIPVGQYDTFAILLWRNRTLMGTDITIEEKETTVFKEYINETESDERLYQVDISKDKIVPDNNTSAVVKLYSTEIAFNNATPGNNYDNRRLFPAASYAYLYEPLVSKYASELKEEYGIHRWWLPSIGELSLYFVQMVCSEGFQEEDNSYASSNTSYQGRRRSTISDTYTRSWRRGERQNITNGTVFNPDVDMFEMQTFVNMFREIKNGNPLKISSPALGSGHWASTETRQESASCINFNAAYIYNESKNSGAVVRPVAAF